MPLAIPMNNLFHEVDIGMIYPNALRIPDENIENATYSGTAHHG